MSLTFKELSVAEIAETKQQAAEQSLNAAKAQRRGLEIDYVLISEGNEPQGQKQTRLEGIEERHAELSKEIDALEKKIKAKK